jgi:site-specific DNA-methyltransferase (adenine-specific)
MQRPLLEKSSDTFIRFNEAISIFRKVKGFGEKSFAEDISPRNPFGIGKNAKIYKEKHDNLIKIYTYPQNGYISKADVERNTNWIGQNKVLLAKAYGERGNFPYLVTGKPFIGEPDSCCSETYLVVRVCENKQQAANVISYMSTRFFRFFVLLKKNTQNTSREVYSFVPEQDFSELWTDEKLYNKYGLNREEIEFIESMVRPMQIGSNEKD